MSYKRNIGKEYASYTTSPNRETKTRLPAASPHPHNARPMSPFATPLRLPLRIAVPCSTSNLGPGFDCLGLALSLWLRVSLVERIPGPVHELELRGTARDWPASAGNHLLRGFDRALAGLAVPAPRMRFEVDSEIPLGRGLGSSGAAIAAGLLLGAELLPERPRMSELLRMGLELEGHPDNAVASLLGGCTIAPDNAVASLLGGCTIAVPYSRGPGEPRGLEVVRQELHKELGFAVAWPAHELSTEDARRALPEQVPFDDAVDNPRRLALLLQGLRTANPTLLALGGEDRLHVAHRLALIPGGAEAMGTAREAGAWIVTLSGAGSGLVAIGPRDRTRVIADAMRGSLARAQGAAEARVVDPVHVVPQVEW